MRALYCGLPTQADLDEAGLTPEECTSPNPDWVYYDLDDEKWYCQVWPENWPALSFYNKWSSQWRVVSGMSGIYYVGLDFGVLLQMLDRLDLSKDEYDDTLGCLREIENEARKHLNKPA